MTSNSPDHFKSFGPSGPLISQLGFGAMGLSTFYGEVPSDDKRLALLSRAHELGCRHWDTADMYADNEDLIGRWFKLNPEKRKDIFLASKFGVAGNGPDGIELRGDPEYVKEACEKSLKRLGVDCIDLYYCHRTDGKTPIEVTVKAMAELQVEGKIKYIGFCEISAKAIRRAVAVHPISAVQMEYSPSFIEAESTTTNILATCREFDIAFVAYSPLGRGIMTAKYSSPSDFEQGDFRTMAARFSEENIRHNLKIVERFKAIAEKKGCTPGQLCLAWLMAQGDNIFLIPGTKKMAYLEENCVSLEVKLDQKDLADLRTIVDEAEVRGERVPAMFAGNLLADTTPL